MNEMEVMSEVVEEEEKARKNRVKMYRSILNYVKARSFSLDVVLSSQQPDTTILPNMKTRQQLEESYKMLHDDITLILSVKDCLKVTQNVLTRLQLENITDKKFLSEIKNKFEGVLYFSKSLMQLYDEQYSELAVMNKKKEYSDALTEVEVHLKQPKETTTEETPNQIKDFEKATRLLYKINLIRAMKSILIGFISLNRPEIFAQVIHLRSPLVRNLRLNDFVKSWDVGASSQN